MKNKNCPWRPCFSLDLINMKTGILRRTSQTLFLPTNILFRLVKVVFTKDNIYKVSANQEQELPMAAIFFPRTKGNEKFSWRICQTLFVQTTKLFGLQLSNEKIFKVSGNQCPCFLTDHDELWGPHIFVPTNILYVLVVSEKKFKISADQKQVLPMAARFFSQMKIKWGLFFIEDIRHN